MKTLFSEESKDGGGGGAGETTTPVPAVTAALSKFGQPMQQVQARKRMPAVPPGESAANVYSKGMRDIAASNRRADFA